MKRPKRDNYSIRIYGEIAYNKQLNRYCSYLENKLKEQQKQHLIDVMQEDEKLGLYDEEQRMYSENEVVNIAVQYFNHYYNISSRGRLPIDHNLQWFEQFKKK